ncbi:MAG: PKD domain-containing protein [Solirubrobacteraceae bacterium]
MTHVHRPRAIAFLASLALASALAGILPGTVRAAEPNGYGELTRFGETASKGGEAGKLGELSARALAVDPTDNSVFLLDETKPSTNTKRVFRLQKFVASPVTHKYSMSASVQFTNTSPAYGQWEPQAEGLAIDPAEGRVYLLAVDLREEALAIDRSLIKKQQYLPVASTLYAFSTKEEGANLVGAGKEGEHKEVLANEADLEAQSATAGKALLEPRGITVDTAKHEVIVLAHVDEKGAKEDNLSSSNDHYVLQRIESSGKLGERYVDTTDFFKNGFKPHSPVAVSTKNDKGETEQHIDVGHVVEGVEDIAEVPYDFKGAAPPHLLSAEPTSGVEPGVFGSSAGSGGRLAAGPEGTLFGLSTIHNESAGAASFAGVVAFSGATGSELGWTGGQQPGSTGSCVIDEPSHVESLPPSLSTTVAAGSGGRVFVLAPEFLLRQEEVVTEVFNEETEEEEEVITFEPLEPPFFGAVVEFGPGGTGCPQASVSPPVARVNGIEVKGEEPVRPGTEVTFSSNVKQADALETEWNFGDGTTQTVKEDQFQTTLVKHKYETTGKRTVTEKIHLDDFAAPESLVWEGGFKSPTVTKTQTININTPVPTARLTGPTSLTPGQSATFDGSTSSDPNKSAIAKYSWNFGDGSSQTTTTPSLAHSFAAAGTYTVSLTVTDALELTSAPATLTVHVETPGGGGGGGGGNGGGGGGGGSGGGGTGGGGTTQTTPNTGGGTPQTGGAGGVLGYKLGVAGTTLSASPAGAVALKVNCAGPSSCTGTVTLKTLSAVSAGAKKKAILTLASGSFSAAGGSVKSVSLHLSAKAKALLARMHVLKAKATIVARDAQGASHTTPIVVTLRAAKKH